VDREGPTDGRSAFQISDGEEAAAKRPSPNHWRLLELERLGYVLDPLRDA
jgi:hypothetical protein